MTITAEYEINFDLLMDYVEEKIESIMRIKFNTDWDTVTDTSKKELYKKIAEHMMANWV